MVISTVVDIMLEKGAHGVTQRSLETEWKLKGQKKTVKVGTLSAGLPTYASKQARYGQQS